MEMIHNIQVILSDGAGVQTLKPVVRSDFWFYLNFQLAKSKCNDFTMN